MAINPPSIGARPIQETKDVVLEIVSDRPQVGNYISPNKTPYSVVGYYDASLNIVELYMVSSAGNQYIKIA